MRRNKTVVLTNDHQNPTSDSMCSMSELSDATEDAANVFEYSALSLPKSVTTVFCRSKKQLLQQLFVCQIGVKLC